jgi:hypothetical protein
MEPVPTDELEKSPRTPIVQGLVGDPFFMFNDNMTAENIGVHQNTVKLDFTENMKKFVCYMKIIHQNGYIIVGKR